MQTSAIITGITGQDGSYLAEYLLERDIQVYGGIRKTSSSPSDLARIQHLLHHPNLFLEHLDLLDPLSIAKFVSFVDNNTHMYRKQGFNPIQVYNLAAQSHVGDSFRIPTVTHQINAVAVLILLDRLHAHFGENDGFRFYQASTSELYGNLKGTGEVVEMDEDTPFNPASPYAVAKAAAFQTVKNYRETYNIHAVNGILFNHESPRRGIDFVTRKITRGVADYALGKIDTPIELGNVNAKRDWGDAREYIEAMYVMLNEAEGETIQDYVVASGTTHSVRKFVTAAFKVIGIQVKWKGKGLDEVAVDIKTNNTLVKINKDFHRPLDVQALLGNPKKIKENLRWQPKTTFEELVEDMVNSDIALLQKNGREWHYEKKCKTNRIDHVHS